MSAATSSTLSAANPARPLSLRRQLLAPLAWIWLFGLLAAAGGAYWLAMASANAAFDRGLQDETAALAARVVWTDRGPLLDVSRQAMETMGWDLEGRNSFALLDEAGHVLAGDPAVPRPELRHQSFSRPVLFDGEFQGETVRGALFSLSSPMLDRSVSVIAIESRHKRARLVRDVLLAMVVPTLVIALLTVSLLAWGIRRGLAPLRQVAREVERRAPNDLRPLPIEGVPAEAVPLIERINSLLADVQASVQLQRRFVADAAHQLRTPVAGLRVLTQELELELRQWESQALADAKPQGASGGAGPDRAPQAGAWQPLMSALLLSSDKLARLIGQLLSLVRSQGAQALAPHQAAIDIRPMLREAAEPMALRAARLGRSLLLDMPDSPVPARVNTLWLGEALSNVLDNALRYGGPNISVRVGMAAVGVQIDIEDDGPGVAPADLPRLVEPFWRGERADVRADVRGSPRSNGLGESASSAGSVGEGDGGTGLGLAIAYEVIQRLGGSWLAQTRPEVAGLRIRWILPS
ncbi:sensor histidine kinase N-terminal domain-containing protein [Paucibacter sp. AS339]|uniref:sensor histidine kinase N-terminal domain-containing protein n=1 Tax=Paucibacter hankyongi TaxID=3133434 RepID=UPI00309DDD9B